MRVIKVESGVLSIGQGVAMLLSSAQRSVRGYGIGKAETVGDVHLCVASGVLQFKSGEVLGVDSLPKIFADKTRPATPDDGEDAMRMLAAAETLGADETVRRSDVGPLAVAAVRDARQRGRR